MLMIIRDRHGGDPYMPIISVSAVLSYSSIRKTPVFRCRLLIIFVRFQTKHSFECRFEIGIAQWVENGIEGGVKITEPYGYGKDGGIDTLVTSTIGHNHE